MSVLRTKPDSSLERGLAAFAPEKSGAIRLSIAGEGVWIEGRFDRWISVEMEAGPKKGDAQLLLDVTATAGVDRQPNDLFAFRSRSTEKVGPLAYLARGIMTRNKVDSEAQMLIQTPSAHGPFVALTISFDRNRHADVWEDLSDMLAAQVVGEELFPRAWLRVPEIASA